jgi:hypothetical protein
MARVRRYLDRGQSENRHAHDRTDDMGIVVIKASGRLSKADYDRFVPAFERIAAARRPVRILIELQDFHGWDLSGPDNTKPKHRYSDFGFVWEREVEVSSPVSLGETSRPTSFFRSACS